MAYEASCSLCAGGALDEGWHVEIKVRSGGKTAGTSDAVSLLGMGCQSSMMLS